MRDLNNIFFLVIIVILVILFGCKEIQTRQAPDIEASINKGVGYLVKNQNNDGSVSLDNDETFKVWETANAVLAVHAATADKSIGKNRSKNIHEFLEKATDFLLKCTREDGSFGHDVSFEKNDYCMETTPLAVLVLSSFKKNISAGVSFMLEKQEPNGSWEIGIAEIRTERFYPSVTGFVLSTLHCLGVYDNASESISNNMRKGIEYILETQGENGRWGSSWQYYDTPYYATYVNLLSLKLYGLEETDNYKRGVSYIKKNQNPDGSWGKDSEGRPSRALRTALALNSLLVSAQTSDSDSQAIEKGISWLIKNQREDGSWDGGEFVNFKDKKEDVYATAMALLALKRYRHYQNDEALLCLNESKLIQTNSKTDE